MSYEYDGVTIHANGCPSSVRDTCDVDQVAVQFVSEFVRLRQSEASFQIEAMREAMRIVRQYGCSWHTTMTVLRENMKLAQERLGKKGLEFDGTPE